jgi:hypothetical protein
MQQHPFWELLIFAPLLWGPVRYLRYIRNLDNAFLQGNQWKGHIEILVKEWSDINLLVCWVSWSHYYEILTLN